MDLSIEGIKGRLDTKIVGKKIEFHRSVSSTNDCIWKAVENGEEEGLVVLADAQTQGRGRHGRTWVARKGSSFLGSILLHPPAISNAPALTVGAALAVCRACESTAPVKCQVKWPNDVMIGGKKVGGILLESRTFGKNPPVFVVGIGVNVNQSTQGFPKELREYATSLRARTRTLQNRNQFAVALLEELDRNYLLIRERRWSGLEVEFFERLGLADQEVLAETPKEKHRGILRAFSLDEGLTLEDESGRKTITPEYIQQITAA